MIIISLLVLRIPFYATHFNIYYTSPTNNLRTQKIPSEIVSCKMTYLHLLYPTYILCLCPAFPESWIPSHTLSLKLTPHVKKILHNTCQYTYLHTRTYLYAFVTKGLNQISKSTLTQVLRYTPFILKTPLEYQKNVTSSHQENHFSSTFTDSTHHLKYYLSTSIFGN